MNCPACQAALPEDAAFCGHCGGALRSERTCVRCGRSNSPEMRFCLGCGAALSPVAPAQAPRAYTPKHLAEKILTSRSALEGERKQVTVLFADVKGSMDLAEQVDPEEWHRIMDRFFAILSEGVHRFEGTINQFTGDGIIALFGAPIAHEDHAQRACWAALHLTDALRLYANELRLARGVSFAVRMGINSGEVVVGRIGDDLRMDYTGQGRTVGLAAAWNSSRSPGRPTSPSTPRGWYQLCSNSRTSARSS
jgi:Adenylate and Guanylate cyclase catalytic domain/Double zinc ribbon